MEQPIKPKRPYNSQRRQSQARQTRLQIIEAARKLFKQRGYSGATIEAIALEAGVSPETVYSTFGNKQAILSKLVDVTIVGDDRPVPLLQRPFILAVKEETDQYLLINKFAQDIYEIMSRMSPIFALLRTTAQSEPEIAALLNKLLKDRLGGMSFFVEQLGRIGPLREWPTSNQAVESVWAISSAEVFDLLTRERGWAKDQYTSWLADTLVRLLLP
jgi:TetR/AcrR family transcriptional regulator, regulator of autoinduction and epiphytic fitness